MEAQSDVPAMPQGLLWRFALSGCVEATEASSQAARLRGPWP